MTDQLKVSRRAFVRNVAAGAAGAALAASAAPLASAAGKVLGEITLDGLMVTYYGAPVVETQSATYELGRAYDMTIALSSPAAPDFPIWASAPEAKKRFFAGWPWTQVESSHVPGAITIAQNTARGEHEWIGVVPPQSPDHTAFISVLRPRIQILGRPDRPRFRFVPGGPEAGGGTLGIADVAALRTQAAEYGLAETTAASWLAQYVTDPAELVEPRYSPVLTTDSGGFTQTALAGTAPRQPITATNSATIVKSTFESGDLTGIFGVGSTIDVAYSSAQEDDHGPLLLLDVKNEGTATASEVLYWDAVFKTFFFVPGP